MAIDTDAIARDARACIADLPVTIRHNSREIQAGLSSQGLTNLLVEGGLADIPNITITALTADFEAKPAIRDTIELRLQDGSWLELEINGLPDILDPTTPDIRITLGSPNAP